MDQILAASPASDWRPLDPERTVQLELPAGRVVIELAPDFAPEHAANVRTLVRAGYFDGLAVVRVQDGFVAQWGDPLAGEPGARPLGSATPALAAGARPPRGRPRPSRRLPDGDVYAPEVGFVDGFAGGAGTPRPASPGWPTATARWAWGATTPPAPGAAPSSTRSSATRRASSTGTSRWSAGWSRASRSSRRCRAAPRPAASTTGPRRAPRSAPPGSPPTCPTAERARLEALRTDSATFAALVEARRNRRDAWYLRPAGKIDLCNVPLPVREAKGRRGGHAAVSRRPAAATVRPGRRLAGAGPRR